jgi:hypothetical protein
MMPDACGVSMVWPHVRLLECGMPRFLPWMAALAAVGAACATAPARPAPALVVHQQVDHLDVVGREPMLVEHPGGALFVAGYGSERPTLWTSADRGGTWRRVDVGTEVDGAVGNSDVDLSVAPDGTLYFVVMQYDRAAFEGRGISIAVSTDAGATWQWTPLSRARFDDRPWVEAGPDGTAHVIWNDGSGMKHRVSRDRGRTWTDPGAVHDKGGSSHLAVGRRGELAVRIAPISASYNRYDAGVDLIAVSLDGGTTWRRHAAPGTRDWAPTWDAQGFTPRWVEPLAWDARGLLYSAWTDKQGVHLARSADHGATWDTGLVIRSEAQAFFPYLVARGDGDLAATWFTQADPSGKGLQGHAARIRYSASEAGGGVALSAPWSPDSLTVKETDGTVASDTAGEYMAAAILRDGTLAVVAPIQDKPAQRRGFTWRRFRAQEAPARGAAR